MSNNNAYAQRAADWISSSGSEKCGLSLNICIHDNDRSHNTSFLKKALNKEHQQELAVTISIFSDRVSGTVQPIAAF